MKPLTVCAFETRRGDEMAALIRRQSAEPTIVPSLREIPVDDETAALQFGDRLVHGGDDPARRIDVVVFLTGVGAQAVWDLLVTRYPAEQLQSALVRTFVVARGPKPVKVLRDLELRIDVRVPEPNTWRELLAAVDATGRSIRGQTVAVLEYGAGSPELVAGLADRGAHVISVPIYRWALPADIGPLETAVRDTIRGAFDVLLFTSAQQGVHFIQVADRLGLREPLLEAAAHCVVGSIGPTASEALRSLGFRPALEPSHPKMGHLVIESIAFARQQPSSV